MKCRRRRLGNAFQARGDVDAITEDIVVIDDDVADVNADAKLDPLIVRDRSVLLGHAALDFNGTADRIYGAGKLDQHAVTGRLDDPAPIGAMVGSTRVFLTAFSRASVPSSSAPMRRLYPATSAASTAASRRSTRSPVKGCPLGWPFQPTVSKHGGLPSG